ncbi:rho guanine nucleotide exchange factor 12 isoform X2 [Coregonus clupeaformis]|uniref:rho guanine nucleotide exchange factor 12 isoform X2 n=1 Tax=Coregonus clupeaformis TaxID=59861 RepID=UPI001E1C869C|nr:rho guanine nucleotide exchange factor 12 isoform X2 [Coregonus clupeaformis]
MEHCFNLSMFSKKATRTPSILSKDHPPDKKPKSDKNTVPPAHEFDPTDVPVQRSGCVVAEGIPPEPCGLVQRCVIIQKDENGFGLTVSGDNPVFVQLVKEDGAAMRAGVQTGDRIIKVNGTLVTHSNHVEVVKLIKSGSYVALTVLGRPPGLAQISLSEGEGGDLSSFLSSSQSPGPTGGTGERCATSSTSPQDHITSPLPLWKENNALHSQKVDILQKMLTKEQEDLQAMKEVYSKNPTAKLLKDIQEAKKHIPLLQSQLSKATGTPQDGSLSPRDSEVEEGGFGAADGEQTPSSRGESGSDGPWTNNTVSPSPLPESPCQRETPCHSPKTTPRESLNSCPSPDVEDTPDLDCNFQSSVGSPLSRLNPQIIGAEDDYFDTEQEQINGQCSCFQSIELLKSRPAHLAAFLHHVVSQFDPAPLLCYLYADLYKQTNSKETRRIFMDFHTFFMDRAANLKVAVPESMASELERRRPELIPEELHRPYTQLLQDTLLPDIQRNLEDFRQKRSMGLTLAEGELAKLDTERVRDRVSLERERSCAEHIISKIEDVLLTSQPTEEEKCTTMQYVILTYMKHLGVKVKEPRSLEPKRVRINFLPKIKKSIKTEKEGEEKVKKPRFPSILGPPRRPSRVDSASISKAMEMNKQRGPQKQLSQPALSVSEHPEFSAGGIRARSQFSDPGSDAVAHPLAFMASPPYSAPASQGSDPTGRDSDSGLSPSSALLRLSSDGLHSGDTQDGMVHLTGTHFDFSPCTLDQLQEEERESDRAQEGGTPKPARRMDGLGCGDVPSEDDQGNEIECEQDPPNWQALVSREVLAGLTPQEIKRQEVINELFYTERAHLRMLKVLDNVFYQKLSRDGILPPGDIKHIFSNLEEIVQLHVWITEQMTVIRKKNETSVIDLIGDDLLAWFSDDEEEKIKRAVGTFCSNQPFALELIKTRQKKDQRFTSFMQEAESNRLCRRLQLKDIIPVEMQRLTKYPLLLESIAKYTEDTEERDKVKRAGECCREILNYVNQTVKEAENKQRLEDYQRRLDLSSLKQSENPMISEFKSLDLTKRKMVHEGPLSWKVNKDKTIELYTLLLEDILVLLQKQDERLVLKCHSKNLAGTADTKHIFSPIIKLNTVLVRSVATDNKSFFVLSMSDNGAQIYELMAQTVSEQRMWQCLITQSAETMKTETHNIIPLPQTDAERDAVEIISTGVPKLSKDPERTSMGCTESPEKDVTSSPGLQPMPTSTNPFDGVKSDDEEEEDSPLPDRREEQEEEEEVEEVDEEEIEAFLDGELADRLPFLQERSRQGIAIDDQEPDDTFGMPPSRAEEALRTLAALRQVLLNHMTSRAEGSNKDKEKGKEKEKEQRKGRAPGGRLLRTTSLRGPEDNNSSTSAPRSAAAPSTGSSENGASERTEAGREEGTPGSMELRSGDTGFFETSEDYGSYMVLEGYGASGESSTDGGGGAQWGPDIDLKKLLSSSSQTGGAGPNLSRQIMTHLRLLQANLQHLKEVETKYNELRQRLTETTADTEENKDKS